MINTTLEKTVCLHELFEAQIDLHPSKLAVICEKRRLTYQELEEHSNQLAHYLRSFGVGSGTFVGIYLTRSEKHIIAILAIFVLVKVLTWLFLKFIAGTIKESAMQIKKDLGKRTLKKLKESD